MLRFLPVGGIEMPVIPRGSVVTILTPDSIFHGKQGVLMEDATSADQKVGVHFGHECSHLFSHFGATFQSNGVMGFIAEELRLDLGFTVENLAERYFGPSGRMYHSTATLKVPFDPAAGLDCTMATCTEKATHTIVVNAWGTVYEVPVCDRCGYWNGKCVEDLNLAKAA